MSAPIASNHQRRPSVCQFSSVVENLGVSQRSQGVMWAEASGAEVEDQLLRQHDQPPLKEEV